MVDRVLKRLDGRLPVVVGRFRPGLAPMRELSGSRHGSGCSRRRGCRRGPSRPTIRPTPSISRSARPRQHAFRPAGLSAHHQCDDRTEGHRAYHQDVPNCVMLKHEDWPGPSKITALRASSDKGETRRISILCGNGGLFLPEEMGRGADGAMTGLCYPEMMVGVVQAYADGKPDRADKSSPLTCPPGALRTTAGHRPCLPANTCWRNAVIKSAALRKPGPKLVAARYSGCRKTAGAAGRSPEGRSAREARARRQESPRSGAGKQGIGSGNRRGARQRGR